jgi:hypothetical protein
LSNVKERLSTRHLLMMLRRIEHGGTTIHGFRSSFSDWASEVSLFGRELRETALARTIKNKAARTYRRGDALEKRREMREARASSVRSKAPSGSDASHRARHRGKSKLANEGETGRPLNNLITGMAEFEHFTAEDAERWTLPMAAAWFIWRDFAAVDGQWKIVTGAWEPAFDPPIYILSHHRQQPGTLTCVFQEAGFACGKRPYMRLQDIRDPPPTETTDPYERLRVALQSGRLRATIVEDSPDEGGLTEREWGKDDWLDFDSLADPANEAPYHVLSDPARYAVLVSREKAITVEAELSTAESKRPVWKLEQALGWIAYRRDRTFRSLSRTDLHPPTFFDRGYKNDFDGAESLATLTSALLAGELHAYVQGTALTRAECISLLSVEDGLWGNRGLVFVPDEMRRIWQRKADNPKIKASKKGQALTDLTEMLKEGKRQRIRVLHDDAESWMKRTHQIDGKPFDAIWRKARERPDVGGDRGGRPTEAEQKASKSFCESYSKTLP